MRITPEELAELRRRYGYKAPCCLCASATGEYIESAFYMATEGPYFGEYVAACTSNHCGYLSESTYTV
jgi:hypothetical protein